MDLLLQFRKGTPDDAAEWAKHSDWRWGAEVLHIDIKGERAVVLTQKWTVQPDSSAREDIVTTYQEISLLAETKAEWKVTSGIWGLN